VKLLHFSNKSNGTSVSVKRRELLADFANQNFFEYTPLSEESQRNCENSRGVSIPTALVTGATGFVGSHTAELLLDRGFDVRCLVRRTRSDIGWLEGKKVEIIRASYYDVDTLRTAVQDSEYIFHIAGVTKAKRQREYREGNVLATKNLLVAAESSSHLKKFCFISSLAAVGPSSDGTPLTEESPCHPITSYGVSKLEAETVCQLHSARIPIVVLRPPAVYGPRDTDLLEMFRLVRHGIKPIIGSREKEVSLIYGPELARAIVDATLSESTKGETYFVSDPKAYRLSDALDLLAGMMGKNGFHVNIPGTILYSLAGIAEFISAFRSKPAALNIEKARDFLQKHWVSSPRKLEAHTGFRTRVSLEDGLRNTLEWYKDSGWL